MKFEYKQIRVVGGIKLGKRDSDTVAPKDLPETLNALGAEGWELVNFAPHSLGEVIIYVFKRPLKP